MEDILPDIYIGISEPSRDFIDNFETIIKKEKSFTYNLEKDIDTPNYDIMSIVPKNNFGHERLFGQLIARPNEKNKIIVEIRAHRWNPEPTNYKDYVSAAKFVFEDLLQKYNSDNKKRYRLNIQSETDTKPKLPSGAKTVFDRFVNNANKTMLHPLDWGRFYSFIRYCHSNKVKIQYEDIMRLLVEESFSEKKAEYLADIFHHGIGLLKK